MGRPESNQPEIRRIRRLLRETVRLAEHASLTGSLDKGSRIAIRQYNHIREHLQDIGAIPEDLFQDLDEDEATFDELGIVCGMLEGYLVDEEEVPVAAWKGSPKVQFGMVGLKELEDLKEIGKVIRDSLPEFLRKQAQGGPPDSIRIEIERGMAAAQAAREQAYQAAGERPSGQEERAQQIAEVTSQIRDVGERLRQPDLQNGQCEELLQQLDRLMTTLQRLASATSAEN